MHDSDLYLRARRGLAASLELFGSSHAQSRVIRLPGVLGSLVPATPERSLFNAVLFDNAAAFETHHQTLAHTYADAGVRAWTVWTDVGDSQLPRRLSAAGHKPDGEPMAMAAELAAMKLPGSGDLDWFETRDPCVVAALNDAAYGLADPTFRRVLSRLSDPRWRAYAARHEGSPACSVLCWDSDDGDCAIAAVATPPQLRGRGYATRLLAQVLRSARERGCVTSSLQSSSKGLPIYIALGYRELGRMQMWELRQS